jgi:hypothetical protein
VGALPWKGLIKNLTTDQKHQTVLKLKVKYTNERLCSRLQGPKFSLTMARFLDYLDKLSFGRRPDYNALKSLLEGCISESEVKWDWSEHF